MIAGRTAVAGERSAGLSALYPVALLGVIVVSVVLRLVAIDSRGLWFDEAARVWGARQPGVTDVLRAAWAQPPSAPLYWLVLHFWILLFGHGDVTVRLLSVVASVGAVGAVYWLGKVVAGQATGLLAAGLLAVSPMAVELGQEATMYAWAMLFAALTMAAGTAWRRTGRGAALYVATATLLLYTHYMGALLLGEMLLVGLFWRPGTPPTRGRWAGVHALVLLLWSPWLVAMCVRLAERWSELSHLQHRAGLTELYASAENLGVGASGMATWSAPQVAACVVVGGCLALLGLSGGPGRSMPAVRVPALLVAGFAGAIVGASALTGAWLVQPRFLALVLPALTVVIAAGFTLPVRQMLERGHVIPVLPVALLLALWLTSQVAGLDSFYTNPVHGRDGVRDAATLLAREVRPGDLVAANEPLLAWSIAQYYDGPIEGLPQSQDVREGYSLWPSPRAADFAGPQWAALSREAASTRRVWLVYLPAMDPRGTFLGNARARFREVGAHSYPFAGVFLFEVPGRAALNICGN